MFGIGLAVVLCLATSSAKENQNCFNIRDSQGRAFLRIEGQPPYNQRNFGLASGWSKNLKVMCYEYLRQLQSTLHVYNNNNKNNISLF